MKFFDFVLELLKLRAETHLGHPVKYINEPILTQPKFFWQLFKK